MTPKTKAMNKLFASQMLATTAMLLEASGPVRLKEQYIESIANIITREREESRERIRLRLEKDRADAAVRHARTSPAEWAKIEKAELRRANKKTAKKALKKTR